MKLLRLVVAVALCLLLSCHPFSCFWPKRLDRDTKITSPHLPESAKLEIWVDKQGIPHVFGQNEEELAFGLGFMHGRDRRFQILATKYAASGRLSEIFGEKTLDFDRHLRMLSYNIDAQYQNLTARDKALITRYADGVNLGIANAKRSIEETLLGVDLEAFTPKDTLLVGRLQAWQLAGDFLDELARTRIEMTGGKKNALNSLLIRSIMTAQTPVVLLSESPFLPAPKSTLALQTQALEEGDKEKVPLPSFLIQDTAFGSNGYVVSGKHTEHGRPVLCNDPHLEHRAPSVFYVAHLEHPSFSAVGATFPGLPAVLIGRGRAVAWGVTASYADVQDLVRLNMMPKSQDYVVDNKTRTLVAHQQRFIYGKKPDEVLEERWYESVFGLVLPPVFDSLKESGEQFALLWGGFEDGTVNSAPISGFWDLAKATSIEEAASAIDRFSFAGISVLLAFNDGTIGYRLAALTPSDRAANERFLPRDGSRLSAHWPGYLPMAERPQVDNPAKGYIIASNQRLVEDGDKRLAAVGGGSGSWSRALRIRERIESLLKHPELISADALLSIQEDSTAPEAQALAPLFASACPRHMKEIDDKLSAQFCDALAHFDGDFTKDNTGGLPYVYMLAAYKDLLLKQGLSPDAANQVGARLFSHLLITEDLYLQKGALSEKTKEVIMHAAPLALAKLKKEFGSTLSNWTWGKYHELTSKGALYPAPLIGGLFATSSRPQAGYAHAPLAETGLPVKAGPVMRMVVDMNDNFARITLDTGNGGTPGHPHFEDMAPHWNRVDPLPVLVDKDQIAHNAEEHFWLLGIKKSV